MDSTMIRKNLLAAFLFGALAWLQAAPLSAQQVTVPDGATATMVWQYSPQCGAGNDYPDVPARPFLVTRPLPAVLWLAANANGFYASVGLGWGPDMLALLQRDTAAGPTCLPWLPLPNYPRSSPQSYNTGLWMVAPITTDGTNVQALVHNEFHGEWTGDTSLCWLQNPQSSIFLPCNYWNLVSASSSNGGLGFFQLLQQPAGTNVPAVALGQPYQVPSDANTPTMLPQGMTAQSNILQVGQYYYVLVQQLPYQAPGTKTPPQSGVCLYRAPVVPPPGGPLTWLGWDGNNYTVAVPPSYPAANSWPLCQPQLGSQFRFSWSYNKELGQIIIVGQDLIANVNTNGCHIAPKATAATVDSAFVYMTATLDAAGHFSPQTPETCLLQINSMANWQGNPSVTGQAYPSLLDPMSPELSPGDLNFMYSGKKPFLYFTQLNPVGDNNPNGYVRDLVRLPLTVTGGTTSR